MIFSDVYLSGIDNILHFKSQSMRFSSLKRGNHIIGIQLSGSALQHFSDRSFTLRENSLYFFNQAEDYRVEMMEIGVAFSITLHDRRQRMAHLVRACGADGV